MIDQPETPQARVDHTPTYDQAIANAARLFHAAEMELDLAKMQRLDELGHSWINLAGLLQHERM